MCLNFVNIHVFLSLLLIQFTFLWDSQLTFRPYKTLILIELVYFHYLQFFFVRVCF